MAFNYYNDLDVRIDENQKKVFTFSGTQFSEVFLAASRFIKEQEEIFLGAIDRKEIPWDNPKYVGCCIISSNIVNDNGDPEVKRPIMLTLIFE